MNKKLIVIVLLIVVAIVSGWLGAKLVSPATPTTFGAANVEPHTFQDELALTNGAIVGWQKLTIQPATAYAVWTNTTGSTVLVVEPSVNIPTGVASSTFKIVLFSTSTATLADSQLTTAVTESNLPIPPYANYATSSIIVIPYTTWATTTSATTTLANISGSAATSNSGVLVPNGYSLIGLMQNVDASCRGTPLATSTTNTSVNFCESATSTNRGFNPIFYFTTIR